MSTSNRKRVTMLTTDAAPATCYLGDRIQTDVAQLIFSFLHGYEVSQLRVLNVDLRRTIDSGVLWRVLVLNDFGCLSYGGSGNDFNYILTQLAAPDPAISSTPGAASRQFQKNFSLYQQAFTLAQAQPRRCVRLSEDLARDGSHGPCARQGSSGCVVELGLKDGSLSDGRLLVFGGWKVQHPSIDQDVWVARRVRPTEVQRSEAASANDSDRMWAWKRLPARGEGRRPSYGHTITYIGGGAAVAFGGVTIGGYRGEMNTVARLQLDDFGGLDDAGSATVQCNRNNDLTPRAYHSATWIPRMQCIILFGGFDETGPMQRLEAFSLPVSDCLPGLRLM